VPPIPGLKESSNVFILRNIPHTDAIYNFIKQKQPKKATVIGGGFIGVEMAENLRERGLLVTLIDMADQVLAPVDYEMAQIVHEELTRHGVRLILKDGVKSFLDNGKFVETASGLKIESDLIILAIGVNAEIKLAKEAGLQIGDLRAIVVDEQMRTSDPDIMHWAMPLKFAPVSMVLKPKSPWHGRPTVKASWWPMRFTAFKTNIPDHWEPRWPKYST
jgi:NADPH-dependent 2,4-dienoyl-CoA reductase/sulfur reductase-like enzyme